MEAIWAHWGWHDYGMGPGMMWGWGDRMDLYDPSLGTHHPGLILLIRWLIGLGEPPKAEETPLDILKKRYAREEINKDEFEQKKDLQ